MLNNCSSGKMIPVSEKTTDKSTEAQNPTDLMVFGCSPHEFWGHADLDKNVKELKTIGFTDFDIFRKDFLIWHSQELDGGKGGQPKMSPATSVAST